MKNVIDINQFRRKVTTEINAGQLANILDKALGCIESNYELCILTALLKKCTRVFSDDGTDVDRSEVLEEAQYSLYRFSLENHAMHLTFEDGLCFELRSVFFLDPELSREISLALELEIELNTGKRRRARLALQEACCTE